MVSNRKNRIEWSPLLYELGDAKEHLEALITQMSNNEEIDEVDYNIQIGHIYAHLNRGWNTRSEVGEYNDKECMKYSSFPDDIEPCG